MFNLKGDNMGENLYALSNPQNSILLTEQYFKNTNINNICGSMTILEPVNFDVFKLAIQKFVENNDSFRIQLTNQGGNAMQYITSFVPFDMELIEVTNKEELESLEKRITHQTFEIYESKLFCFTLFRFPDGHGGFIINAHHLIADSWGLGIMVNEVVENYSKLLHKENVITKTDYSYLNYLSSEKEYLESDKCAKDKAYWDSIYSSVPEIATIPSISSTSTAETDLAAKRTEFTISKEMLDSIKAYCNVYKLSLFNFFMSIIAIYTGKISSIDDFVLGTPILNRSNFKEKNTCGMFINTLPLRVTLQGDITFSDFASKVATDSMGLLRHQKYSYQSIIEDLRKKDSGLPSLYNILVSYQITKMNENSETIPHESRWNFNETISDDIDIHLFDLNDFGCLNIAYDYRLCKYSYKDILAMHERVCAMIHQILSDECILLKDIEIVTPEEKRVLLEEFNNTTANYPKDSTVIQLFEEQVIKNPDAIAVKFQNQELTYSMLNEKANQLASYLLTLDILPNSVVSVCMHKNIDFVCSILAIQKIGCAYLPINPNYPIERINYIIEDSNSAICLTNTNLSLLNSISYHEIELSTYQYSNLGHTISSTDLAYVIYTSGSTGNPKGVMVEHRNLINFIYSFNAMFKKPFCKDDVGLSLTNISFDVCVCELFVPLVFGASLVLYPEDVVTDIPLLVQTILDNKVSFTYLPPNLLMDIYHFIIHHHLHFPVTKLLVGVEAIKNETLNHYLDLNSSLEIINGYGPTETTICCTFFYFERTEHNSQNVSIGHPVRNNSIYIVNKYKNLCPIGCAGELYVSGNNVTRGYLNNATLTEKSFQPDFLNPSFTTYSTGDMAFWNPDGSLHFIGRNDSQVKLHGHRIELSEVTNILKSIPGISNAITILQSIHDIPALCSYVCTSIYSSSKEILELLVQKLPYYMIPSHIVLLSSMPTTLNGKIDVKKLPEIKISMDHRIPLKTETQKKLATLWCSILNLPEAISYDVNFFELGGDSLSTIRLTTEIYEQFNISLASTDIFAYPTIIHLSEYLDSLCGSKSHIKKAPKSAYYPTTSSQRRIYYANSLDNKNSILYNVVGGILLDTLPDLVKLENCINILLQRHESLRTSFHLIDGTIMQQVHEKEMVTLNIYTETEIASNSDLKDFILSFDLSNAPLLQVSLFKLKNGNYLLLFDTHHIVCDGISFSILINEFCNLYNDVCLPNNEIDYTDFTYWENSSLRKNTLEENKQFWLSSLSDELPVLNLPTTFQRPSCITFEGNSIFDFIPNDLSKKIMEICKKLDVTPYIFLLTIYYILLYKYSDQSDIIVGAIVNGRMFPELSNMIGMFVNTLPLRSKIDSSIGFSEYLNEIKQLCDSAFYHQDYPFDELINQLNIQRDSSRAPLFDTVFVYQNMTNFEINLKNIVCSPYVIESNISKFDLTLEITPENDMFKMRTEYRTDLFSANYIKSFMEHYLTIIRLVVQDLDATVSSIKMLSQEEERKLLTTFSYFVPYNKESTVVELLENHANYHANQLAIRFEDDSITYRDFNERVNQLAYYLIMNNVTKNSVVAIMLERSIETIVCMFAILKAGGTYLLIDPSLPENRIEYMLKDSKSELLITNKVINQVTFSNMLFLDSIDISSYSTDNINIQICNEDGFSIIYTSGSTGIPKGVVLKHLGVVNLLLSYKDVLHTDICDNFLSISTVSFDMFIVEVFICLLSGKTLTLTNEEQQKIPIKMSKLILENHIDFLLTTPSRIDLLLCDESTASCLKELKVIQLGGEVLTKSLYMRLTQYTSAHIYNGYGPTEITACCTCKDVTSENNISIGSPMCNTQILILNHDLNLCPIGIPGELCVGGDGVSNGYLYNPDLTKKSFIKNPFGENIIYRTGDIAEYTENGDLNYIGRKDHQIKIRGLRVELSEIENQLLKLAYIKNCAVLYQKDTNDAFLIAYFVSEQTVDISYIREELSKVLPLYMVPKYIVQLETLPMNHNGKVDKKTLASYEVFVVTANYIEPETEKQKLFCSILEGLLHTKVGITNDIFELGADSLIAIKFKTDLLSHNIDLPYADIFKYPTVREMCENHVNLIPSSPETTFDYTQINTVLEKNILLNLRDHSIHTSLHNNILLLGATGFVGSHVLYEFLKHDTGIAYCLIRDKNGVNAYERLQNTLHFYFGTELDALIEKRIFVIKTNITDENLGLPAKEYQALAQNIDTIINAAALVKHFGSEDVFKVINIDVAKNLIEFCRTFNKRLIHISSTSVSGDSTIYDDVNSQVSSGISFSENNLYIGQNLDNIYIRSKFEAEKLILQNIYDGLHAQILRLGNITSRYEDGKFQINPNENAFINRLKTFIQLGCIPETLLHTPLEFTPVDSCAKGIVSILQNDIENCSVLHLFNNHYIHMQDLWQVLKGFNFDISSLSEDGFSNLLKTISADETKKDMLSGIINDISSSSNLAYSSHINVLSEYSRYWLHNIDFDWPIIDTNYLTKYIQYLKEINFI